MKGEFRSLKTIKTKTIILNTDFVPLESSYLLDVFGRLKNIHVQSVAPQAFKVLILILCNYVLFR